MIIIRKKVLIEEKNKTVVSKLRIIMLEYSAKKIKANHPPMYSTLNPDTSSDSPSAKSKGLRFTSARHLVNHIINKNKFPIKNHSKFWEFMICVKLKEFLSMDTYKMIKKKETS